MEKEEGEEGPLMLHKALKYKVETLPKTFLNNQKFELLDTADIDEGCSAWQHTSF